MKRDRGRLNSRTRETRTYSLTNALSGRFTRHASHAFNAHNGIDRVVGRAGCRPAPGRPWGGGGPHPRKVTRHRFRYFTCATCVVDVQFHIQGGSKSTRRAPDRRAYKYGTYSSRDPCDPIPPHLPRAPHLFCFVSCHGSPRCFQTGIPVSTRLINRHGVTMKSRSFPQLCVFTRVRDEFRV